MAKKPKLLSDLFHDTLKDVYFAEKKILTTLPKMAKAAQSRELKAAFGTRGRRGGRLSASNKSLRSSARKSRRRNAKRSWASPKRVPRS
jgi:ferritin-like metal-binding protein YciE